MFWEESLKIKDAAAEINLHNSVIPACLTAVRLVGNPYF
jgi:hypothetical protein